MRKTTDGRRLFSREFKVAAVRRVLRGEELGKVARELDIGYELLWGWRNRVKAKGEQALHEIGGRRGPKTEPITDESLKKRIADLERLIGHKELEISFLDKALRQVEESRQKKNDAGATASSK
jgi:transposase